jgi:hypothetical protein
MFSYVHSGLATQVFQMFKISRTEVPKFTTHKIIIVKTYNIIMLVQLNSFIFPGFLGPECKMATGDQKPKQE